MKKFYFKLLIALMFFSSSMAQNLPSNVSSSGLISYWPLDGNVNDLSSNQNNGISNQMSWGTDRFGNTNSTANFNSVYQRYITISNPKNFTGGTYSFSFWLKTNSNLSYYNTILELVGSGIYIQMYGPYSSYVSGGVVGNLGTCGYLGYNKSNTKVNDGSWHNVILTIDYINGIGDYYIDGVFDNSISFNGFTPTATTRIDIGQNLNESSNPTTGPQGIFGGELDDIAIYNRIITNNEIIQLSSTCSNPIANITPQSPTTFCQGNTVNLITTQGNNYGYQWYLNNQLINGANNYSYQASTPGDYTVKITDGVCNSTSSATKVTVNPIPTISFPAINSICLNQQAFSLSFATPIGGTYSGNGISSNILNPIQAGVGTHVITYNYTDPNTLCSNSSTQSITINSLPNVSINSVPSYIAQNGNSINLTGNPSGGIFSGNGITNNVLYPQNSNLGKIDIVYTYTDNNNCSSSSNQSVIIFDTLGTVCSQYIYETDTLIININTSGINQKPSYNQIKIYPNPATDYVLINTGNYSTVSNYLIEIDNSLGQTVYSNLINQQSFQISTNSFGGKGVYIVKIIDDKSNVITTRKIILQ